MKSGIFISMNHYVLIEKYKSKQCTKCKEYFPATLDFFHKKKTGVSHLNASCKICVGIRVKSYYKEHEGERKEYRKEYYKNNKEFENNRNSKYWNTNIETIKIQRKGYEKERSRTDIIFKLKRNISSSIRQAIKRKKYNKNNKTIEILGCTYEEFKVHIESQFEHWMTWDNYGLYNGEYNFGWDLDHIVPVESAKTKEDVLRLNHYTNFQPLCSYTNRYLKIDKLNFV